MLREMGDMLAAMAAQSPVALVLETSTGQTLRASICCATSRTASLTSGSSSSAPTAPATWS